MVAEAVEPGATGMGALGRTLVASLLLNEVVATEDVPIVKGETTVVLLARNVKQIARKEDLVEEVPSALEGESALTLAAQEFPPGIEEVSSLHFAHLAAATEETGHRGVVGVVVEVAHDDDALLGVGLGNAVSKVAHLLASQTTIVGRGSAAGPVADDDGEFFASQASLHRKETTRGTAVVARVVNIRLKEGVLDLEELGVVYEGAVHTATVGTLDMHEAHATIPERYLINKVGHDTGVLHLRDTDDDSPGEHLVRAQVGQATRHVAEFVPIFVLCPVVGAIGQEIVVVLVLVMNRVEEVLQIVESHRIESILLLGFRRNRKGQPQKQQKGYSVHNETTLQYY